MDGFGLFYTFLLISSILGVILLFAVKNLKISKITNVVIGFWSILLTWINLTGLPTNFTVERLIALLFGAIGLIGLLLVLLAKKDNYILVGKIMIALSIVLSLFNIFF